MIGPEVMRAFKGWWSNGRNGWADPPIYPSECYPLYIGHALNGRWYVRERMPGTRVWRAEDDGSFTLIDAAWSTDASLMHVAPPRDLTP